MTKKLLPLLVVLAAISSLVFFSTIKSATKGNNDMTEAATENVSIALETSMGQHHYRNRYGQRTEYWCKLFGLC